MPVQLSCTESALSEFEPGPVAVSEAPPVLSELLQPRPRPEGLLLQGQAITPFWPGSQVTTPCASTRASAMEDSTRADRIHFEIIAVESGTRRASRS